MVLQICLGHLNFNSLVKLSKKTWLGVYLIYHHTPQRAKGFSG
jgi:hypothetical protein